VATIGLRAGPGGNDARLATTLCTNQLASVTINSVRALFEGGPVYHDLWQAVLWCVGIFVVFLSLNLYRKATA
jgi:hypothetical protein